MFIPANSDPGEAYGDTAEETASLLHAHLYKTDIVACRMLGHLVIQFRYDINEHKLNYKGAIQNLNEALRPKGFVNNDGVSVAWYEGHLYFRGKDDDIIRKVI